MCNYKVRVSEVAWQRSDFIDTFTHGKYILFKRCDGHIYRIAGKFGRESNLAIWLSTAKISTAYMYTWQYRTIPPN